MALIPLMLTFAVVMVVLWVIRTYVPGDPMLKNLLTVLVVLFLLLWLLQAFGVVGAIGGVKLC